MRINITGLVAAISLLGCVGGSDEVPDVNWEEAAEEGTIPQAAAEIMAAVGGTSNVAPQYFACPKYLVWSTWGMDEWGNYITNDWNAPVEGYTQVNSVTWTNWGNQQLYLNCGTNQCSPFIGGMYVAKWITGTQCSTSNDTPQNDGYWFVCW